MKHVLAVFVPLVVAASCASSPSAADVDPRDGATSSVPVLERPRLGETPEADELRIVVEADGKIEGWTSVSRPTAVTPAPDRGPLVEVHWTDNSTASRLESDEPNAVSSIRFFGECDANCELRLKTEVELAIQVAPTPAIRLAVCPTCSDIDKLSVFEAEGATIRGLVQSEMFEALAPIDSVEELTFLFEDLQFARAADDGWDVITAVYADPYCFPVDTRYVMWSMDSVGTRTQVAHFDVQINEDEEEVSCA